MALGLGRGGGVRERAGGREEEAFGFVGFFVLDDPASFFFFLGRSSSPSS
jgi:hypothetical protein